MNHPRSAFGAPPEGGLFILCPSQPHPPFGPRYRSLLRWCRDFDTSVRTKVGGVYRVNTLRKWRPSQPHPPFGLRVRSLLRPCRDFDTSVRTEVGGVHRVNTLRKRRPSQPHPPFGPRYRSLLRPCQASIPQSERRWAACTASTPFGNGALRSPTRRSG